MDESHVSGKGAIPADGHATEVFRPRVRSLHFVSPLVPTQLATVLERTIHAITPIRYDKADSLRQNFRTKFIVVIALVRNHSFRNLLFRAYFPMRCFAAAIPSTVCFAKCPS